MSWEQLVRAGPSTRFLFRTAHGKSVGIWRLALETPNFYCAPYNRKRASKRYNLQQIVVSQKGNCSNIADGAKYEVICSRHTYRFYDVNPVRMIAVLDKNRATPMRNKGLVSTRMRLSSIHRNGVLINLGILLTSVITWKSEKDTSWDYLPLILRAIPSGNEYYCKGNEKKTRSSGLI